MMTTLGTTVPGHALPGCRLRRVTEYIQQHLDNDLTLAELRRRHDDIQTPAISTVHAVLDRHGLVERARRRRSKLQGTALSKPLRPNDLWCADYKGEFILAPGIYDGISARVAARASVAGSLESGRSPVPAPLLSSS